MSSPFVGVWTIEAWPTGSQPLPEEIPMDAFQVGGSLDISPDPPSSSNTFLLNWHDQKGDPHSASDLHPALNLEGLELKGRDLHVDFGCGRVNCTFALTLIRATDPKKLSCTITPLESQVRRGDKKHPEVGSGTFTATATGG